MKMNILKWVIPLGSRGFLNFFSDEIYLKLAYRSRFGRKLNLDDPKSFNEKLQWLKLNDNRLNDSKLVDKYEVRKYIKETLGESYLIPLIGLYDSFDDILWNELPKRFVMKLTHGSGCNVICLNKDELEYYDTKKLVNKWMKKNWFWFGREYVYKNIKPRIVIEKFISDNNCTPDDYKVLCFGGKAKLIEVHIDRFGNHKQDFYDRDFNKTNISQSNLSDKSYEKPLIFDEMIVLSEKLASNFIHLRIDWYVVSGKLYFGEITFYDGSGFAVFDDFEDDLRLGEWIDITKHRNLERR